MTSVVLGNWAFPSPGGREPVLSEAKEWTAAGVFTSRRGPGEGPVSARG
jgi:hypothetical protein